MDPGLIAILKVFNTNRYLKKIYAFFCRYLFKDPVTAGLVENLHPKTVAEAWSLTSRREGYRARWFDAWEEAGVDFVLSVPNALPAVPHGGMKTSSSNCGYALLFNLVSVVLRLSCKFYC